MLLQVLWVLKESFVGIELPCVYSSIGVATHNTRAMCNVSVNRWRVSSRYDVNNSEVDFNVLEL